MPNPFRRRKANNNSNGNSSSATAGGGSSGGGGRSRRLGRGAGALSTSAPPTSQALATALAQSIPQSSTQHQSTHANNNANGPYTCHTCRQPIPRTSRHIHTSRTLSGQRRYHRECFVCLHCNAPIDPQNQSFCYAKLDNREGSAHSNSSGAARGGMMNNSEDSEHPFHRECFAHHFGWMCVVCEKPLPMVTKVNNPAPITDGNNTNNPEGGGGGGGSKSTKVEFLKHPFFEKERMCPHHARRPGSRENNDGQRSDSSGGQQGGVMEDGNLPFSDPNNATENNNNRNNTILSTSEEFVGEIRRCAGCHRFEPLFADSSKHFIDVGDKDTGRCVCLACCRTVVTGNDDVIPLWEKVIDFFEGPLGLLTSEDSNNRNITGVTRRDLESIPVIVVGMEALNDNMKQRQSESSHFGSQQIMTRGLCLSEHTPAHPLEKAAMAGGDMGGSGIARRGTNCDCIQGVGCIGVTAILCLSGLPADLTASILAHEATHAWIKLHPNFPYTTPLPLKVEEGICQLVAFLFLNDGLEPVKKEESFSSLSSHHGDSSSRAVRGGCGSEEKVDESIPSDEKLRQYFRFCIETDEGVYGEGFRLAARAYAKMGMEELMYHVALYRDFPPL